MPEAPAILFTAFEPSGDEHAAPVIADLRKLMPGVTIHALGGPKMEAAGARLIEQTTGNAAMLAGAVSKVSEQLRLRRRMQAWLEMHPIAVHVPTDSPAANWAICKLVKRRWATPLVPSSTLNPQLPTPSPALGRVVHLVAPQVWAWANWRVRRLQQWSDLVLCLLPFEPAWFAKHNIPARFIGHPLFDHALDAEQMQWQSVSYGGGSPKLALLPGSRPGEVIANWSVMRSVVENLRGRYGKLEAVAAAADPATAKLITDGPVPRYTKVVVGQTDAVLHWADLALTVSGTATLHVARHLKPMAVLYRVNPLTWHGVGRWIIDTGTFTLPNLIACGGPDPTAARHIVKEFVPWLGGTHAVSPIVAELESLIELPQKRDAQIAALRKVVAAFDHHRAGPEAAAAITEIARQSPAVPA